MANIEADVTLPSGELITVTVDESWTDEQIHSALVSSGDISGEAAPAVAPAVEEGGVPGTGLERAALGYLETTPIQGALSELMEQKLGTRDDVTTEKMVPREEGLPDDVPAFEGDPGVKMVPQTFTQPGITEEQIRARQNSQREIQNRTVFPELMKDADAVRDTVSYKAGMSVSYLLDLVAAPIPGANAKALAELAKSGTKVLSTVEGRAALGAAAKEGSKVGSVFAGADNTIRQLQSTGELDLAQMGTATVLGGVGGAVLAPVLAANLGKLLSKFGTKLDTGAKVTADELTDMAPELNESQISDLLAGFDEASFAAKYEPKVKIAMDSNVSAAKTERAGERAKYEARRDIARAKSAEARSELAVVAEKKANVDPMVDLKRNENAPRWKKDSTGKRWYNREYDKGDLKGGFKFGNGAIERLEHIAAGFSPAIRKVGQTTNSNTARDVRRADLYYKHKDYVRMSKQDRRTLDTAMADSDGPKIREINDKYGSDLSANYEKNVRGLTDEIGTIKRAQDKTKGFIGGYHPRTVKSVRAARRRMGRKDRTALDEALRATSEKKGRPLDAHETEAIIRQYLRPGGNAKLTNRRVDTVGEENIDLYESPRDSLMSYIHRHHEEVSTREFFENTLGIEGVKDGVADPESISKAMTKAMLNGDMPERDVAEAAELVTAIFGQGRQAMDPTLQAGKSIATVGVIGNPISTLTQVQDLAQLMDQYGLPATLRSLFGKNIMDTYDVGLRSVVQDTKTNHGYAKVLNGFMKASGFQGLDKIMATTGVNASLRTNFALAKKNPAKALKKMTDLGFAEGRARKLVDDLKARRVTDDVKVLNIVEQGKIRPIGVEDLPAWAVKHPDGRVFATLLSWTAKQANRIRNGAIADMRNGHPIRGTRKLASLLGLMGATGASVGTIKDFVRGKETDLSAEGLRDSFVTNMFALGMSGKYFFDALDRGGGGAMETLAPYAGIWGDILTGVVQGGQKLAEGEIMAGVDELTDGVGSLRNYKQIAMEGPMPELGMDVLKGSAGLFGAAYDTLFEPKAGQPAEQAIETASVRRVHPDPEGNGGDLMPPVENVTEEYTLDNTLKGWENSIQSGLDQRTGLWYGHKSIEKGLPTIAYGHKITGPENRRGKLKIGNEMVDFSNGLTEEQANTLFEQDTAVARQHVLNTVSIPLSPNEMVALTSLMYNIGPGKAGCKPVCWHNSKARAALNRGDREEFMKETYDPVYGFVKVNGEPHDGLIKRRAKEKRVFMGG